MLNRDLARSIRARADACGISIRELTARAGVAGNVLWRWEQPGLVEKPRQSMIDRMEAVLIEMEKNYDAKTQ